jgi:hypothetical protein
MSVPMSSSNLPRLLRRAEASRYLSRRYKLKRSVGTLGAYASAGTGPVYRKISGVCFYAVDDLDRYASKLVTSAVRKASEHGKSASKKRKSKKPKRPANSKKQKRRALAAAPTPATAEPVLNESGDAPVSKSSRRSRSSRRPTRRSGAAV